MFSPKRNKIVFKNLTRATGYNTDTNHSLGKKLYSYSYHDMKAVEGVRLTGGMGGLNPYAMQTPILVIITP